MAAARRLAAVSGLLGAVLVHGQGLRGSPVCPCVDPWRLPSGGTPENLTYVQEATKRGCLRGDAGNCYPLDYGSTRCFAWDVNLAPRCADLEGRPLTNAPKFCGQPWCYVDPSCSLRSHQSSMFPGHGLYYSYETCRAVDFFSPELLLSTMRGKTLRAGVPAPSAGYEWTADFVRYLMDIVGVTVQIQEISNESTSEFPLSTYSACARDVALGTLDFCYGAFWETPERLVATAFTSIFDTDILYLVVPGGGSEGAFSMSMIGKVFAPFSPELWAFIFVMALLVGLSMWLFGEVGNVSVLSGTLLGLHMAVLQFFGHGGFDKANTRSGKILLVGFSFMCMLCLASYTANLSSFLLMSSMDTGLRGVDDAVQQGVKLCVLEPLAGLVVGSHPQAANMLVKLDTWGHVLDAYHAGECGGMLMSVKKLMYARSATPPFDRHGEKGHCDLRYVGDPAVTVPYATPISRDIENALNYVWARERFAGKAEEFKRSHPVPPNSCPAMTGLREGAVAMRASDFLGAFLLFFIIFAVAGSIFFWKHGMGAL